MYIPSRGRSAHVAVGTGRGASGAGRIFQRCASAASTSGPSLSDFAAAGHRYGPAAKGKYANRGGRGCAGAQRSGSKRSASGQSYEFFTKVARERAPAWRNEITLRSIEMTSEFEGGAFIGRISPTPVRLIVMRDDVVSLADEAIDFYESAREPKSLVLLPGNHYECYVEQFAATSTASTEWFVEHLVDSTPVGASRPVPVEELPRATVNGVSP